MQDPIDRGLPFVLDDRWHTPVNHEKTSQADGIFQPLEFAIEALEPLKVSTEGETTHFEFSIDLPSLPEKNSSSGSSQTSPVHVIPRLDEDNQPFDLGTWSLDDLSPHKEPARLRTWEAFYKAADAHAGGPALLSEAGPAAFDAAVSSLALHKSIGVFPQDLTLRALCNLAVGRASTLFQWHKDRGQFVPTLEGVPISGLSPSSSASLVESLISTGTLIATLRTFTESQHTLQRSVARSAIKSFISIALSAIDESMSEELSSVPSILQLQNLAHRPRRLLLMLVRIVREIEGIHDDNDIMSMITKCINDEAQIESDLRQISETILAQISIPWFEKVAASIGFTDPASVFLLGIDQDKELPALLDGLPSFVPHGDVALIQQTSEAIRTLRKHAPSHSLLSDAGHSHADQSPFKSFTDPDMTHARAVNFALEYELRILSTQPASQDGSVRIQSQMSHSRSSADARVEDEMALLLDLDAHVPGVVGTETAGASKLREQVLLACISHGERSDEAIHREEITEVVTPLGRVRPIIAMQHKLVNTVLLHQLFDEHSLMDHLEVQRQFHLFGNGAFVTRLCTALFSADVQSAERRRGKMPTAETMGLRLGTTHEERWPPASSELQLTMMGILAEAYTGNWRKNVQTKISAAQLPGSLSFAIRQLPEEDIDRVLDPNSLYALDFLRLQYIAQSPLDVIFTAAALDSYDQIFRFLLRLLRLVHITGALPRRKLENGKTMTRAPALHFFMQARNFVNVLTAHMIDIGTRAPWESFISEMTQIHHDIGQRVRQDKRHSSTGLGMHTLRQLHDACLEQMRSRLFLKRRQEKVRTAIENVLSTILRLSFALQAGQSAETVNSAELSTSIKDLHSLLESFVDSPNKGEATINERDTDMARILLLKLNWNYFYDGG